MPRRFSLAQPTSGTYDAKRAEPFPTGGLARGGRVALAKDADKALDRGEYLGNYCVRQRPPMALLSGLYIRRIY